MLAVLTGCTVERASGEFGAGACTDRADNDDDGVADCSDPDCQAEAICGRSASLREPDGEPQPTPAGATGPAPMTDPDASMRPTEPVGRIDAGGSEPSPTLPNPDPPPDAATQQPPQCPVCAADESCIDGDCVPNDAVFVELWDVTSISVVMPRGTDAFTCLDELCLLIEMSDGPAGFRTCRCQPDPFVRIQVLRPGEDPATVVTTAYKKDEDEWTWDERRQLQLRPDYQLKVQVLDRDGTTSNPVAFECTFPADPDLLGSGVLECTHRFEGAGGVPFDASLRVAVEAAAAAAMP